MLLDLENDGNEVYYSAPAFHEPWELNDAYLNHQVKARSIWVRPSWVGPLPDEDDHHVAFKHPGQRYFCSKVRLIENKIGVEEFTKQIETAVKEKGSSALSEKRLYQTAERLTEISRKRKDISYQAYEKARRDLENRKPIEQVAFYAHMFLDAQMFIVNQIQ